MADQQIIPVAMDLGADLQSLTDGWSPTAPSLSWRIESGLIDVLRELSVPGTVTVTTPLDPLVRGARVRVRGEEQKYSVDLVRRIVDYLCGPELDTHALTADWAKELSAKLPPARMADVLTQLVVEVVKQHPDALLSEPQAETWLEPAKPFLTMNEQADGNDAPPLPRLERILRGLLRLRLSLKDDDGSQALHIAKCIKQGQEDFEVVESLASRMNPNKITVEINRSYATQLFKGWDAKRPISAYDAQFSEESRNLFQKLADDIFRELGVRLPDIVLRPIDALHERGFAVRINHLTGVPVRGLTANEILVNVPLVNLLLLGFDGRAAINPADHNPGSLADAALKEAIEEKNIETWDALGYLVLMLSADIRRNAGCLLHREVVEYELALLRDGFPNALPDLIGAVLETTHIKLLTRVLRELLHEEVSIRDLKTILGRVLTADFVVSETGRDIVFDDRLALSSEPRADWRDDGHSLTQYVRAGMKQYLSHKYTRGQSTMNALLLDPEIEEKLLDHLAFERSTPEKRAQTPEKRALTAEEREKLIAAVRREAGNLPPQTASPVILTSSEIRWFLRRMIAPEFPGLAVLAWDELAPDLNIQPLARISL